jgi:hypothetical protein
VWNSSTFILVWNLNPTKASFFWARFDRILSA